MAQETEFKFLLADRDHESLLCLLGEPRRELRLTNRYFTLSEPVQRRDWVLRLRVTNGEAMELTLKIGREVQPGVFDSVEYTQPVTSVDPKDWVSTEPLEVLRREISTSPLRFQGELRNTRREFRAPIAVGEIWEVDSAELPNGETFHELEVEVEANDLESLEAGRSDLERWLVSNGIAFRMSDKTKYNRFLLSLP